MKMKNKTYDVLKYVVTILAPALMTFVATLGTIGLLGDTEIYVAVIGAVATFVGALINVSSNQYHKED